MSTAQATRDGWTLHWPHAATNSAALLAHAARIRRAACNAPSHVRACMLPLYCALARQFVAQARAARLIEESTS